ncbi:MAG: hypothetical protein ACJ76Q_08660 [Solirubrobacteraceae bacterium]
MRWRERRPGDPGVEAVVADLGEWGPELLALRAEPRPEFLARLDRRMQPEFAGLLPALGIAVPAAAAAVVAAVLIAGSGGSSGEDKLPVAVQSQPRPKAAGGAAAPESESALSRPGGPSAPAIGIVSRQVAAGEPFVLRYWAPRAGSVFVSLSPTGGGSATSTRRVGLPAGSGRLRIATDELTGGSYALVVTLPSGQSALRARVRILD